jgi:hypothetical protein
MSEPKLLSHKLLIILILLFVSISISFGWFAYQEFKKPQQENQTQQSPEPQAIIPSPSSNPTADWKTYNEKTFSLKLPISWQKDESFSQNTDEVRFTNQTKLADLTILSSPTEISFYELESQPTKNIIIDNIKTEQKIGYGGEASSVFIIKSVLLTPDSKFYAIISTTQDKALESGLIEEYNQILSTFKFLDQNSQQNTECGGWDTSGEIICECSGKIIKPKYPADAICDGASYICSGLCGKCCYRGMAQNDKYPKCPE